MYANILFAVNHFAINVCCLDLSIPDGIGFCLGGVGVVDGEVR